MSSQADTIDRVYRLFNQLPMDAAERRASPGTDELLSQFHVDIEFTQPALQPDAQFYKGHEALRGSWDQWFEMWEHHRSTPVEVVEHGNRVLVLSHDHFRGREGVELEQKGGAIFTFDGAKIVRLEAFFDHETARREFERLNAV